MRLRRPPSDSRSEGGPSPRHGGTARPAASRGRRRPGAAILGPVTWQWIAVGVIELLAVGYLVHRVVGPRRRPASLEKPDVKASALVRKKRSL